MKQHFERKTPHIFMITIIFCKYNNYLTKAKENEKKYYFFSCGQGSDPYTQWNSFNFVKAPSDGFYSK